MNRLWRWLDSDWKELSQKFRLRWGITLLKMLYWMIFPWVSLWIKFYDLLDLRQCEKSLWVDPQKNQSIPEYFVEPDESPVQAARKQY